MARPCGRRLVSRLCALRRNRLGDFVSDGDISGRESRDASPFPSANILGSLRGKAPSFPEEEAKADDETKGLRRKARHAFTAVDPAGAKAYAVRRGALLPDCGPR